MQQLHGACTARKKSGRRKPGGKRSNVTLMYAGHGCAQTMQARKPRQKQEKFSTPVAGYRWRAQGVIAKLGMHKAAPKAPACAVRELHPKSNPFAVTDRTSGPWCQSDVMPMLDPFDSELNRRICHVRTCCNCWCLWNLGLRGAEGGPWHIPGSKTTIFPTRLFHQ